MAGDTAKNIVNATAVQLGLVPFSAKLADPFASTDQNIGLLCQLFTTLGRDVRKSRQWNLLRQTYVFQTTANQGAYALPTDFGRSIDQSGWNRSNRLPLLGPLSPQDFQRLKAMLVGVTFNLMFEQVRNNFQAFPDNSTPGSYIIAYEYVSSFWARPAASALPTAGAWNNGTVYSAGATVTHGGNLYSTTAGGTSGTYGPVGTSGTISDGVVNWTWVSVAGADNVAASTDNVLFDAELMLKGLKWLWRMEKGFDATFAEEQYLEELSKSADDDAVAPKLNLSTSAEGIPLIGEQSVPWTGFGQ